MKTKFSAYVASYPALRRAEDDLNESSCDFLIMHISCRHEAAAIPTESAAGHEVACIFQQPGNDQDAIDPIFLIAGRKTPANAAQPKRLTAEADAATTWST